MLRDRKRHDDDHDHDHSAYEYGLGGCGLLDAAAAALPARDDGRDEGRALVRADKDHVERLIKGHLGRLLPVQPDDTRATARL